ncbi:MAG: hypothetical protein RL376_340, partial [Verrucomicrobiota bacterium]
AFNRREAIGGEHVYAEHHGGCLRQRGGAELGGGRRGGLGGG